MGKDEMGRVDLERVARWEVVGVVGRVEREHIGMGGDLRDLQQHLPADGQLHKSLEHTAVR